MIGMNLAGLSKEELETVCRCLQAAVDGPFFPDWEFQTLFGLEREEVRSVVDQWPDVDIADQSVMSAVNNSLNNLSGYPHGQSELLERMVGSSETKLRQLLRTLKSDGTM